MMVLVWGTMGMGYDGDGARWGWFVEGAAVELICYAVLIGNNNLLIPMIPIR